MPLHPSEIAAFIAVVIAAGIIGAVVNLLRGERRG
jgi:hypothetical protein